METQAVSGHIISDSEPLAEARAVADHNANNAKHLGHVAIYAVISYKMEYST